jgi:phosphoglycerol transferase MdoB-like AlkP superfamily enzyme
MNKQILTGIGLCILGQILVWLQMNAQFMWPATRNYIWLLAIIFGTLTTYIFMIGFGDIARGFGDDVWAARLITNATSICIFTILTCTFLKQGLDAKNIICIFLSFAIVAIQFFWKN